LTYHESVILRRFHVKEIDTVGNITRMTHRQNIIRWLASPART